MPKADQHEKAFKIPVKFDEAIKRALTVKPPAEGWTAYEKKQKAKKRRRAPKSVA